MNCYRWSDLQTGLKAEFPVTITPPMLDSFRGLSGDVNPLHMDSEFARGHGYRDVVVFGMLVASFYSTLAGVYLPGKFCLLHDLHIHFTSPVYVGDTLQVGGEIVHLNEAYRQMEIKARIERSSVLVSRAKLRAGIHE